MKLITRLFAVCAAFALLVVPAAAQTRVDALPTPAAFEKARFEFALTLFGEPVAVGQGVIDGPNRLHLTLKTLDLPDLPAETIEAILYDGVYYTRQNDDPQWYIDGELAAPLPEDALPIDAELPDLPITLIGAVDVAGVPTDHYQIWFNFEDGSVITLDTFIGQQTPYLHKLQINAYTEADETLALLSFAYRYYDFEAEEIVVYRPENAIPRPEGEGVFDGLSRDVRLGMFQLRDALHWQMR